MVAKLPPFPLGGGHQDCTFNCFDRKYFLVVQFVALKWIIIPPFGSIIGFFIYMCRLLGKLLHAASAVLLPLFVRQKTHLSPSEGDTKIVFLFFRLYQSIIGSICFIVFKSNISIIINHFQNLYYITT